MLTNRTPNMTGGFHLRSTMRSSFRGGEALQHRASAAADGIQILQKHLRMAWSDRRDIVGSMAVAGIRWVRHEPETASPVAADPDLVRTEELGNVVVLHASGVPHQPRDRVRSRCRWFGERRDVDAVDDAAGQRWDAAVELEEQRSDFHTPIPSRTRVPVARGAPSPSRPDSAMSSIAGPRGRRTCGSGASNRRIRRSLAVFARSRSFRGA